MSLNSDTTRSLTAPPSEPDTESYDGSLDHGLAAAFGPDSRADDGSRPFELRDGPPDPHRPAQASSAAAVGADPGRYELLGEIARGGMGIILKGRDLALRRDVAVKVLKADLAGSPATEHRFVDEARVTGRLQHPGVVPIYDLGRSADGRPFFAMKLVNGRTLADLLAERPDPAADRGRFLKIFEQVCHTVAYAHAMGVIHRDLKPANIMVGEFAEVQVMDWGLAKLLPRTGPAAGGWATAGEAAGDPTADSEQPDIGIGGRETAVGSVLGTPAFMPPEQAAGQNDKVDSRADVFGLGAILCVVLTGRPPYVGNSVEDTRWLAIRGDVTGAMARLAECGADGELVELCRRCLDPDREARPADARVVARAVSAYLGGVEERARRAEVERAEAVAREAEGRKRLRAQRALAVAVLATLGIGAAAGTWFVTDRVARSKELDRAWAEAGRLIPAAADGAPAQRLATTRAALTAARTADAQFGFAVGGADLRDQVRATITRLQDQERDLLVLIDLEAAWLRQAEVTAEKRTFDRALAVPVYAEAFRKAGLDVLGGDSKEAAEAVRSRQSLRTELAAALDAWAEIDPDDANRKRLAEVARLTDPDSPRARLAPLIRKRDSRAVSEFVRRLDVRTLQPTVAVEMARQLCASETRYPNLAAALLRGVHDYHPNDFWVNFELGEMYHLTDPPRTDEVLRFYTAALAARPDVPLVYTKVGYVLFARGREAEAMAAFRRAINLNGQCFQARKMLIQHADPAERARYVAELEQLARDLPEDVGVQRDLGEMYLRQRQFDRAAEQLRHVTDLAPGSWLAWAWLGESFREMNRPGEAIAAFRQAHHLAPGQDDIRNRLLTMLRDTGAAQDELRIFKGWYDRLRADDPRRANWAPQLKYLERQADVERRLADFEEARAEPASAGEAVIVASLWQRKGRYPVAVRFYVRAFERNPALAESRQSVDRYNAACAAARAAAESDPADVRARYRKQALDWLRADLAARKSQAKTEPEQAALRRFLRDTVRPDPDLAGVRSAWSLMRLPADERGEWVQFWADVAALEKAMGTPAPVSRSQEAKR